MVLNLQLKERKHRTEDSTHIQEIEIIDDRKVLKSFPSYLGNLNNKSNLVKQVFQKLREKLPYVLTSSQTIYLANLNGATDRVTSKSSERIYFYCDHEEAVTKMFAYIKFLSNNIRLNRITIVSPDTDVTVISLY